MSNASSQPDRRDRLIGFYDALAMIQTECFMDQFIQSAVVPVRDKDMQGLEWLHEAIRNQWEHFVPMFYRAPVQDLVAAAELCIHLSRKLIFESGNVIFHTISRDDVEKLFNQILVQLNSNKSPQA